MFLYKRENGIWYVAYTIGGKRIRRSTKCRKKADALQFIRELEDIHTHSINGNSNKPVRILLSIFRTEYLEFSKVEHKKKTFETHRSCLNELQKFLKHDTYLDEITERTIERFLHYKKEDVSVHTARRLHAHLSGAFSQAVRWGYLKHNVFKNIKKPIPPEIRPLFLSVDEYHKLIEAIDDADFRDLVIVGVMTGMRSAEIRNLKFGDIIFDGNNSLINVVNTADFTTKNSRVRSIPMNNEVLSIMKYRHRKFNEDNPSGYVFRNSRGGIIDEHTVSKKFKKAVRKAGLNDKFNFHTCRHTFCSWLVAKGVDLYRVSRLAGHSSITVTQRYSHLRPENLRTEVERISTSILTIPDELL